MILIILCVNVILLGHCTSAQGPTPLPVTNTSDLPIITTRMNYPPTITAEPEDVEIIYKEQESERLTCLAEGNPPPTYSWLMDEKPFDPSARDYRVAVVPGEGTLIFADPLVQDQALYQCLATNQLGTAATIKINFRKAYLEPFVGEGDFNKSPKLLVKRVGEMLSITCRPPASYPPAQYIWVKMADSGPFSVIRQDQRVSVDPEGNLIFANLLATDATNSGSYYACAATNTKMRRTVYGFKTQITVNQGSPTNSPAQRIYSDPTQQIAMIGDIKQLTCIFAGQPTPRVTWERKATNGSVIDMSPRTSVENFGKLLQITNVQFDDAGTYECAGINAIMNREIRFSFNLFTEAAPSWTVIPQSVDAAEGETAVFSCEATGNPIPQIFWYINNVPIAKVPSDPRRVVQSNKLIFYNMTKDLSQTIQCNATNKHAYIFINVYLNVGNEPAVIVTPPLIGQKAAETQTILMTCQVFGKPKPLVIWRKGSEQLTGGRYTIMPEGHLQITDVSVVDAGTYTCEASNKFGISSAIGTLIVRRHTQILTYPKSIMVYTNTDAKFTCMATTDPEEIQNLQIIWMKDDANIDYAREQRVFRNTMDNSLTVSGALTLDTGKYSCVAQSALDNATADAQLIVQAPPDPPTTPVVLCTQPGRNGTQITWSPGSENYAPILQFKVQYNTSFQPDTWYDIGPSNITNVIRSIVVTLSAYGNYTFRVLASNKIGWSEPSLSSRTTCITEPGLPVKNPDNVYGEGDLPNNLVVFWTPMQQIDQNGPGFGYVVNWRRLDVPDVVHPEPIDDWTVWFHYINLDTYNPPVQPYTKFEISVKARNARGEASTPVQIYTGYSGEAVPEAIPSDAHLSADPTLLQSTSAHLEWTQVNTDPSVLHGFFRGYRVEYGKKSEWPTTTHFQDFIINAPDYYPRQRPRLRHTREIIEDGNNTNHVVEVKLVELPPHSDIVALVRVLTKYYAGPASALIEFHTPEGLPGPPSLLSVFSTGSTHFDLKWSPPTQHNGVLQGYAISYQSLHGLNFGPLQYRQEIADASVLTARLAGLTPDTMYRVYIGAYTVAGIGDKIFLDFRTIQAGSKPTPPIFQISHVNSTAFNVMWSPSRRTSNPGSIFYVQYRRRTKYQWFSSADEYVANNMWIAQLDPGTVYQVRVIAKNGDGIESPGEYQEVVTVGVAPGHYNLGVSAWFYGIFISLVLVIAILVIFLLIKYKYADERWRVIEAQIDDIEREQKAQLAVIKSGFPLDIGISNPYAPIEEREVLYENDNNEVFDPRSIVINKDVLYDNPNVGYGQGGAAAADTKV